MKSSLRTRLILIVSGMLVITFACICIANIFFLPKFYQTEKVSQMNSVYNQIYSVCSAAKWEEMDEDEKSDIYDKIDRISSNGNVNVYIMQVRAFSTGEIGINYVYPADDARMRQIMRSQVEKYLQYPSYAGNGEEYEILQQTQNYNVCKVYDERVASSFIELTGNMPDDYWVYLRANYQSIQESVGVSNRFLMIGGAFVVLLGIFIMMFVSNSYTKPILRLAKHAREIQKLNFSTRYTEERDDEIGILGNSMNALSDELEKKISELKNANNELQLDLQRRTELEEMRQEFLANVSHELKTPIALIQGYAEGLQDNVNEDEESRNFYCEVIVDEANKMNKMVKKLLTLNQLEFGNNQVHLEHFDLNALITSIIQSTEILFQQKSVTLSYQQSDEPLMVWADEYMVEEVLSNYVSNALNHVKKENKIEIKKEILEDKVRVSVFNTGEPIPEEDLEKIWTKFYKVDKARTREYGGNGIGLSIVKAVMEGHNQKYGVKNYENGVEFWFELDMKSVD